MAGELGRQALRLETTPELAPCTGPAVLAAACHPEGIPQSVAMSVSLSLAVFCKPQLEEAAASILLHRLALLVCRCVRVQVQSLADLRDESHRIERSSNPAAGDRERPILSHSSAMPEANTAEKPSQEGISDVKPPQQLSPRKHESPLLQPSPELAQALPAVQASVGLPTPLHCPASRQEN